MNMMEYLERDKEAFLQKLDEAGSIDRAETVIREEFARLLMQYNETCEEPLRRDVASLMMQTARLSSGLVNSVGETKIWEEINGKDNTKPERTLKQKLSFGAGAISGIFSVFCGVFANAGESLQITQLIVSVVFMILAVLCGWFAGKSDSNGKNGKTIPSAYHTENRINAQHVYTCMHNMIFAADQDLGRLEVPSVPQIEDKEMGNSGNVPATEIELFSDLLEGLYCEDGEYALDKLRSVKHYLHQNGIEVVAYDGKNRELFDFMPSMKAGTFRPALVSDGKILKRGLASGGGA